METSPKVSNAVEPGDLEQTVTGGPYRPGDIENLRVKDNVFGEVGEGGPDYRSVRIELSIHAGPLSGANTRLRSAGSQLQFSC